MIFLGATVLTEDPNRSEDPSHTVKRSKIRIDSITGPFAEFTKGMSSRQGRPFSWYMENRAAINEFRAFLNERRGRFAPFWIPTWQHDFALTHDVTNGDATLVVKNINYTRHQFDPLFTWRRYIAFIQIGVGIQFIRRIDGSAESTNTTETLSLDAAILQDMQAEYWMVSFLTLCRLDQDNPTLHWHSPTLAESMLQIIELPAEMPQVPV
jgi:hypothetical protein